MLTIKNFKKQVGVHITVNHNDKMEGMQSLSTSTLLNKFCQSYAKCVDNICHYCYAGKMLKRFTNLEKALAKNHKILTSRILEDDEIPFLNCAFFRFEAFGDLSNDIQFINYIKIANANPHCNFAIWTKNPFIMASVFHNGYEKPQNMIIILSSLKTNVQADNTLFKFVDKVFTVYDKETIKEKNIDINCGGKKCATCLLCYKHNDVRIINEEIK